MLLARGLFRAVVLLVAGWAVLAATTPASAQNVVQAGVAIDASGLLSMQLFPDPTGQLMQQRLAVARESLPPDLARRSDLRMVSLRRLEAAIEAQRDIDRPPTDEMKYLAGLTRVQYVFLYPESGDVVIAGPAEGWVTDLSGRAVGMQSGLPMLELQDLVAAMRAFAPGQRGGPMIGCSIDPTPEGLAAMQNFLRTMGGRATPNQTQYIVDGLRTSLGLQRVSVLGVSPDTHFAQVMVEADYRMKLIGIGLEAAPVRMTTFIARADTSVARNALFRWYFVPDYECVRVSDDRQAMELVGDGVKLVGEDEMVSSDGQRRAAATNGSRASVAFTTSFTQQYPNIAARVPVYAQLRNLIDLSVAAAYMQQEDFYGNANWTASTLLSEERLPIQTHRTPVSVDTTVNGIWRGNHLLTPVAGGVSIDADRALLSDNLLDDADGRVSAAREGISLDHLAPGQWWWD